MITGHGVPVKWGGKCFMGNAVLCSGPELSYQHVSNSAMDQILPGFIEINSFLMKLSYVYFPLDFLPGAC
jgi:hypothetical protein